MDIIHTAFEKAAELGPFYKLLVAIGASYICATAWSFYDSWRKGLTAIPTVGSQWLGGLVCMGTNRWMVEEGYRKYPNGLFKVPMFPFGMMVVANGSKLTDEIRNGVEQYFSFDSFFDRMAAASYTVDPEVVHNPYHIQVIGKRLTRNIVNLFGEVMDEIQQAYNGVLNVPANGDWQSICVYEAIGKIATRTTNRVSVGSPLCADPVFLSDVNKYATDMMTRAHLINAFPQWTHPVIGRLISNPNLYVKRWQKIFGPMIEERLKNLRELGDEWTDRPNDYIMWLIEAAPKNKPPTAAHLIKELLLFNFAGIHTTTMAMTHALYKLGLYPEHIQTLREEAESVIGQYGWSKTSVQKLHKADSFLRESARHNPNAIVGMTRQIIKDYTFSNGVTLKKGTWISASSLAMHMDSSVYEAAQDFKPWRFYEASQKTEDYAKNQYVVTSNEYLAFGAGRHACPGRFFAATELKAMLAYLVLNYDLKFEKEGTTCPDNMYIGSAILPNNGARMLFRKRADSKLKFDI